MSENIHSGMSYPIDAVILWVDGNDPVLAEKRNLYLKKENKSASDPGALPLRFASSNEIRYCVFSILTFAPFVRNIFIVTDGQDPDLYGELKTFFPEREGILKIVDHKEIYRGYEQYLPSFNSSSIQSLIWRIEGLSENFIYFNDDVFLIRRVEPQDWFIDGRPVLRGKWLIPPFHKILGNYLKAFVNTKLRHNPDFKPKISFYIRQWQTASLAGYRSRYFFHCHTPHPLNRSTLEKYFSENRELLEKNIAYRFRNHTQFIITSLANHLEIRDGNRQLSKLNLEYLHPYYSEKRLHKKMAHCDREYGIKSVCVQSIEMLSRPLQEKIFTWMDSVLNLQART